MKTTAVILAAFLSTAAVLSQQITPVPTAAQVPTPLPTPGPLQFQEVVQVEGATKGQLYDAALRWFPVTFRSGKDVLQIQDKEAGTLAGTAVEPYRWSGGLLVGTMGGTILYRVVVEVKDGRYRATIEGFNSESPHGAQFAFGALTSEASPPRGRAEGIAPWARGKAWADIKQRATAVATALLVSLKAALATAATEKPW